MIEQRTYLPNGIVITDARIQDVTAIADVVVEGSVNAYLSNEYRSQEGRSQAEAQIQNVKSPEFHTTLQDRYKNSIKHPHGGPVYVAWSRRGILGVGSGEINKFGQHELSSLYNKDPGNGIGTVLLDEVNSWQQQQGANRSFLYVASFTPAVHFYERKGYKFCGAGMESNRLDRTYIRLTPMQTALPRQAGKCFFDRQ